MAFNPINFSFPRKVPFLPDRGTEAEFNGVTIIAEFGRLMVVRKSNGKIALKIGDGANTPANTNFIGDAIVEKSITPTLTVGGFNPAVDPDGMTLTEFAEQLLTPYQNVNLASIAATPNSFEVGQTYNGSLALSFLPAPLTNFVQITFTSSPDIFGGPIVTILPVTSVAVNVVYNVPTILPITGVALGTRGETVTRNTNLTWNTRLYYGSSVNDTLADIDDVKALSSSLLTAGRQRDYSFISGYSFICIPSNISIAGIGFVDVDIITGNELLPADWTQLSDVTGLNDYGVSVTYKVFRSTYAYGGATKTRVK